MISTVVVEEKEKSKNQYKKLKHGKNKNTEKPKTPATGERHKSRTTAGCKDKQIGHQYKNA